MTRISFGLDLSLSASGVTAIVEGTDVPRLAVCTVPSLPANATVEEELIRMTRMAGKVITVIRNVMLPGDDCLFNIEGPVVGMIGGKSDERAGLRWIIALNLRPLGRLMFTPPANVKQFWTGNGAADKKTMMHFAALRYPGMALLDNNAVDALSLAAVGATHLGFNLTPRTPAVNELALAKLRWPVDPTKGSPENVKTTARQ